MGGLCNGFHGSFSPFSQCEVSLEMTRRGRGVRRENGHGSLSVRHPDKGGNCAVSAIEIELRWEKGWPRYAENLNQFHPASLTAEAIAKAVRQVFPLSEVSFDVSRRDSQRRRLTVVNNVLCVLRALCVPYLKTDRLLILPISATNFILLSGKPLI